MANNDNQQSINELRREVLDDRANSINRWLTVITLVLAYFAVVVAITGFLGYSSFQEIRSDAKSSVEEAKAHVERAKQLVQEIEQNRDRSREIVQNLDAEKVDEDPKAAEQLIRDVRKNPEASLINKVIADAISFQEEERWSEAIEKWTVIANFAKDTDNDLAARAFFSIGYLLHASGEDHEDIIAANDEAIRLKPDYAMAYFNRGNAKYSLGRYKEAISDYNDAIRLNPDYAAAYLYRGNANDMLGRHNEAITDYNDAIRLNPDNAAAYLSRGNANNMLSRHQEAITDYNDAIRLNPDSAAAYLNRGSAKYSLGQYKEAISDYDEAIRLKPDYASAYLSRGNAKNALRLNIEALQDYNKAHELEQKVDDG